ncbi:MAG: tyrosinase family protein [Acidobacteriota bacterium]
MKLVSRIAGVLVVTSLFVQALYAQKAVRLSWEEFSRDPKRVQSFRNAVAEMKKRSLADPSTAEFRTSWVYWASMHGYFGDTAKSGTVATWRKNNNLTDSRYDPYFVDVPNTTPPDAIAKAIWDQCQHGTNYFFAWHRLFLFYFEQVLEDAAGDPTLRLPYWDYTDPTHVAMPAEFTSPTYTNLAGQTGVANPLFESRRAAGWQPPGTLTLDEQDTNIDLALDNPNLLTTTDSNGDDVLGYQRTIELSPHGYAHCAVIGCRATVMGAVPYSSNDPIFWIHHANIDRLWDCWMSISGHKNPSSIMAQPFSYVNAKGLKVTKMVRNLFDGSLIDYVYEQPSNCARTRAAPVLAATPAPKMGATAVKSAKAALQKPVKIGVSTEAMSIDAPKTRKSVSLPATASLNHPRQFALRAQKELPVATELILRGVHFRMHPGRSFKVYLERQGTPVKRAYVGTMSFFSDEPAGSEHNHAQSGTRVFDATAALRALGLEGTGTLNVDVVFEAVDEASGVEFDPVATKLVVDKIEFDVKRDL